MAEFDLNAQKPKDTLNAGQIIRIANRMLFNINNNLVLHNERTAYIAFTIVKNCPMNSHCSIDNLIIMALFHTIGFFRPDPIYNTNPFSSDIQLFSTDKSIESKYMFAYYYLQFLTPLGSDAEALENFSQPFDENLKKYLYQTDYKSIIYLSARISEYLAKNPEANLPEDINDLAPNQFDPDYAEAFNKANKNNAVRNKLLGHAFFPELENFIYTIRMSPDDTHKLLKLLVYFLDFKSTVTVKHSINTACYAFSLGKRLHMDDEQLNTLFTASIIHDIGKIATPTRILEFPGKLTPEEMSIMRYHVNHTKRILGNIVSPEIFLAAYRHHEKLNGSGYPLKLSAEKLNTIQRTLTIADITSALTDNRSYKGEFSKDRTLGIITDMTEKGELDKEIVSTLTEYFDQIIEEQASLKEFLQVDFSSVMAHYNDYLFNDATQLTDDIFDETETVEVLEDLEDLEDLEEI